jgi:hypothetical protein
LGIRSALIAHIAGTLFAAILVYFLSPFMAEISGMTTTFVYIVMYALLAIWSWREGKKIKSGKYQKADETTKTLDKYSE